MQFATLAKATGPGHGGGDGDGEGEGGHQSHNRRDRRTDGDIRQGGGWNQAGGDNRIWPITGHQLSFSGQTRQRDRFPLQVAIRQVVCRGHRVRESVSRLRKKRLSERRHSPGANLQSRHQEPQPESRGRNARQSDVARRKASWESDHDQRDYQLADGDIPGSHSGGRLLQRPLKRRPGRRGEDRKTIIQLCHSLLNMCIVVCVQFP